MLEYYLKRFLFVMVFSCTPDQDNSYVMYVILGQKLLNYPCFLSHRIRISEFLPWDRKSYLTHAIFKVKARHHVKLHLSVFRDFWKLILK